MPKCIIIGAGIAGLTSAVYLSKSGMNVELFEASPKLGGRAYSFNSTEQNTIVDNGQHILMGCYKNTLEYLSQINALKYLSFQNHLRVNYIKRGGEHFKLEAVGKFYPFNLILGFLNFKAIPLFDRVKIIGLLKIVLTAKHSDCEGLTVNEWLISHKQSKESISLFWEMLVVSIMNTSSQCASVKLFISTLRKVFLTGNAGSTLVIPNMGLSDVFCKNAVETIENQNGNIHYSERVIELKFKSNQIIKVITDKDTYSDFDFIISAVPFYSLLKFYPQKSIAQFEKYFDYSPIVTVHLWLNHNNFNNDFYGFLDSKIHWLFNQKTHISLLTSNAADLINKTKGEILKIFVTELECFIPEFNSKNILSSKIIKEKRATFLPSNKFENIRPDIKSNYNNLMFAGDWTNTGFPSTIEGAVKSGITASSVVQNMFQDSIE